MNVFFGIFAMKILNPTFSNTYSAACVYNITLNSITPKDLSDCNT